MIASPGESTARIYALGNATEALVGFDVGLALPSTASWLGAPIDARVLLLLVSPAPPPGRQSRLPEVLRLH